ncbi:MAG: response regulator [Candidatus Binatia bacterium]|jgi:signal transduction histidine kinase
MEETDTADVRGVRQKNEELDALNGELRDPLEVTKTLSGFINNGVQQTDAARLLPPDQVEILVVEDSPTQAALLRAILEHRGYRVTHAENGEHALALARQCKPALVISDIIMPVMDGFCLCQALKQDAATAEVPVILLTALTDSRGIISALKAGADYYLTKPYDQDHLLSQIAFVLSLPPQRFKTEDECLEVDIAGERETIKTNRRQLINLLFATYENTARQNQKLAEMRNKLAAFNKRLEAQVRERTAALSAEIEKRKRKEVLLQQAKEAADAGSRAKSQFLANMSHEIRTPMAGVLGMTELLLQTDLTSQQRKHVEMVRSSGDTLMVVINQILDFSKIEAGGLTVEATDFSLRGTLEEAMSLLAVPAQQKNLQLRWQVAPEIRDALVGDAGHLRQVLLNLVGNAIKFTQQGEVAVEVEMADGRWPMADGGSLLAGDEGEVHQPSAICHLRFSVRDTGMGILKEKHETIFSAFEQADNSHARQFGGTGLGLAISSRLVALMGGRIWVESEVGHGSTFHFTALFGIGDATSPSAVGTAPDNASTSVAAVSDQRPALPPLRILLAEDNPVNQELTLGMLKGRGHAVTIANNGREAVAAVQRCPFDVVLMDLQMPEMDGREAAAAIRADEAASHVHLPIIAMTANALLSERARCLAAGMDEYVTKPVRPKVLFEVIARCLDNASPGDTQGELIAEGAQS